MQNLEVAAGQFSLKGIHFEVGEGRCASLMGVSGSGKSSIMEAICGLRNVVSGHIWVGEQEVTQVAPAKRNVGLVPQDNVLFSTMTVREQIAYGPKVRKWDRGAIERRVSIVAEELNISKLLDRKPKFLSGGESKRVAIARAIAPKPRVLCLDESFTGLDDKTHREVMHVVKLAVKAERMTTLFITHHKSEAEELADLHFFIEEGNLKQVE